MRSYIIAGMLCSLTWIAVTVLPTLVLTDAELELSHVMAALDKIEPGDSAIPNAVEEPEVVADKLEERRKRMGDAVVFCLDRRICRILTEAEANNHVVEFKTRLGDDAWDEYVRLWKTDGIPQLCAIAINSVSVMTPAELDELHTAISTQSEQFYTLLFDDEFNGIFEEIAVEVETQAMENSARRRVSESRNVRY